MKLWPSATATDWLAPPSRRFLKARWRFAFACLAVMPALTGTAQNSGASSTTVAPSDAFRQQMSQLVDNRDQMLDANARMLMSEAQAKRASFEAANTERLRQLDSDSALILKLASELKAEIDMAPQDALSLSALRKAEEIGRLAHNVQVKMKLTVGAD